MNFSNKDLERFAPSQMYHNFLTSVGINFKTMPYMKSKRDDKGKLRWYAVFSYDQLRTAEGHRVRMISVTYREIRGTANFQEYRTF